MAGACTLAGIMERVAASIRWTIKAIVAQKRKELLDRYRRPQEETGNALKRNLVMFLTALDGKLECL